MKAFKWFNEREEHTKFFLILGAIALVILAWTQAPNVANAFRKVGPCGVHVGDSVQFRAGGRNYPYMRVTGFSDGWIQFGTQSIKADTMTNVRIGCRH